ncbi:hypothetical protein EAY24_21635 [Vibrio anguillarum]|uniref:TPM domain-containing protein n=1 Tax=Vibrio anguillarum TaxID=55601 RepID=UPI00188A4733|nr:TPM domain-containing protein [Vibrio anguillarum]MBF4256826.1 hypothetical protein [Vibrio anguillarum]MBF4278209.1 hypothetical protein [Vibrio anguillarum]MBF4295870.1 hypothetical protein [Vibrio anguillarum]MBF4298806.1 hypothetical protein [Vibrio anguillarum]MBF4362647.1 hypothetical protein [Vibrio anguillarum]
MIRRTFKHLFSSWFLLHRIFPASLLKEIEQAIAEGEKKHTGELRFAIEARLSLADLLSGTTSRSRAEQVFTEQRIWDTEHNNGILIYLLLAERCVEVVVDRGMANYVEQAQWDTICLRMYECFAQGLWRQGSIEVINQANSFLTRYFPDPLVNNPNELCPISQLFCSLYDGLPSLWWSFSSQNHNE